MYFAGIATEIIKNEEQLDYEIYVFVLEKGTRGAEVIQSIEQKFDNLTIPECREKRLKIILYLMEQYKDIKILIEYEK